MAATRVEAVTRLAGPGPKRILELGGGSGFASAALASAGHGVVAIDLVDECVEHHEARGRHRRWLTQSHRGRLLLGRT
jgi:protein-L-isoaspartate O-methyltransferase